MGIIDSKQNSFAMGINIGFLAILVTYCSGCQFVFNTFTEKVEVYPSNSQPISHQLWTSILNDHLDEKNGLLDYSSLKNDPRIEEYIQLLDTHHPNEANWTKNEQKAYWINAYNAYTVQLIVQHYPVASIKDIKGGVPMINSVWDQDFIKIEDAVYNLNNIEHGILRKQFNDPRIHFAINCASISCPNISISAYEASTLDEQLDHAGRKFVNDESKNIISDKNIQISKIFNWFSADFTKDGDIIQFLNKFSEAPISPNSNIKYLSYNWNLNDILAK